MKKSNCILRVCSCLFLHRSSLSNKWKSSIFFFFLECNYFINLFTDSFICVCLFVCLLVGFLFFVFLG